MKTIRKIIIAIAAILAVACNHGSSAAGTADKSRENNSVQSDKIISAINAYRNMNGFDVLSIGSFGTNFLKKVLKTGMNEDSEEIVKAIKDINKMVLVDFSDSDSIVRKDFVQRMDEILANSTLLMEIKDEEGNMYMYGVTDDNESSVKDFVLYSPNRGNIICLFGTIAIDSVSKMAER